METLAANPEAAAARTIIIEENIERMLPFVEWGAQVSRTEQKNLIAEAAKKFGVPYLRWQLVKHERGKTIVPGNITHTGFEGYFIGQDPEEVIRLQTQLGANFLNALARQFMYSPDRLNAIVRTLYGENYSNPRDVLFLEAEFGAMLARARAFQSNGDLDKFKERTQRLAASSRLVLGAQKQTMELFVMEFPDEFSPVTVPSTQTFQLDENYDAVAQLARLGHPLIRGVHTAIGKDPNIRVR